MEANLTAAKLKYAVERQCWPTMPHIYVRRYGEPTYYLCMNYSRVRMRHSRPSIDECLEYYKYHTGRLKVKVSLDIEIEETQRLRCQRVDQEFIEKYLYADVPDVVGGNEFAADNDSELRLPRAAIIETPMSSITNHSLFEEYDCPVEFEEYDYLVEFEEYDYPVEFEEYDCSTEFEEYDYPVEFEEYDYPVEFEEYDYPIEFEEYDCSTEFEEYDYPVEFEEYDCSAEFEEYDCPVEFEEYDDVSATSFKKSPKRASRRRKHRAIQAPRQTLSM